MRRREFLVLAGVVGAFPRVAWGQQAKVPRVVWLSIPANPVYPQALVQGLADIGYVDGKNILVEMVTAPTNADLPAYAAKIVATKPDVILPYGTPGAVAVKAATAAIPIVFLQSADPIGAGLVGSLAHPGGNVTGTSWLGPELVARQVAMLKELLPNLKRFAVPVFPTDQLNALLVPQVEVASNALSIEAAYTNFVDGQDIASQFQPILAGETQGVLLLAFSGLNASRDLLFDIFLRAKIPVLATSPVLAGEATPFTGVVCYSADHVKQIRESGAKMVDAILGGTKPGDIPVEQATVFDVGVNLDLAKKIGVTVPQSILAQATLVIDYDIRALQGATK